RQATPCNASFQASYFGMPSRSTAAALSMSSDAFSSSVRLATRFLTRSLRGRSGFLNSWVLGEVGDDGFGFGAGSGGCRHAVMLTTASAATPARRGAVFMEAASKAQGSMESCYSRPDCPQWGRHPETCTACCRDRWRGSRHSSSESFLHD